MICTTSNTSTWQHHSSTFHPKHQSRLRSRVHVCPSWQQKFPGGVTLFLEKSLRFYDTVHFHGNLAVVALRPLDAPCVKMGQGFVEPDAVLRLKGCQNNGWNEKGGAMLVRGNLDVRGELHIRDSRAAEKGGSLGWSFFFAAWTSAAVMRRCRKRWLDSKLPKGLSWGWIRSPLR